MILSRRNRAHGAEIKRLSQAERLLLTKNITTMTVLNIRACARGMLVGLQVDGATSCIQIALCFTSSILGTCETGYLRQAEAHGPLSPRHWNVSPGAETCHNRLRRHPRRAEKSLFYRHW